MPDDHDPQRRFRELPALAPAERRSFPAPVPAVVAAIDALAEEHGLKDISFEATATWTIYDRDLSAWIEVTASPAGERTEVLVCVYPQPPPIELPTPMDRAGPLLDNILVPLGFFALLCLLMIYPVVMLTALVAVLVTFTVLLVTHRLARRRHARAIAAWGNGWRRAFWPALEQHLQPTRLYR
jgi:hypothetical protein